MAIVLLVAVLVGVVLYVRSQPAGPVAPNRTVWVPSSPGLALAGGGAATGVAMFLSFGAGEGTVASVVLAVTGAAAAVALAAGLLTLGTRWPPPAGRMHGVGSAVLAVGLALMAIGHVTVAAGGPGHWLLSPAFHLVVPVGLVVWGWSCREAARRPSWTSKLAITMGALGLVYAPLFALMFLSGYRIDPDGLPAPVVLVGFAANQLYVLAFLTGWIALGLAVMRDADPGPAAPSDVDLTTGGPPTATA